MVRLKKKDAEDAPAELEEGTKATIDELKEVNLGNIENPRPIYISASLTHREEGTYIALLNEFKDVFAWSYKKMPELDPKVAVHHQSVKKGARPVKQDATTGHEALSFMDGSFRYNQIRMAPIDEELMAFRTPTGIYCYKVIPFGLKNADATYQRAMQKIFDDMLHKKMSNATLMTWCKVKEARESFS
ncbi:UNVERIFIED_CONTAM: hypothetical protein Sradi_2689600 [Sesamum radiatum]|uniref:Reverse transcriptase domain-containing protein n=1 Tax=Sesamum radiatum TaxID=300843 RepID=A0AAW2S6H7_SESRA